MYKVIIYRLKYMSSFEIQFKIQFYILQIVLAMLGKFVLWTTILGRYESLVYADV